MVTTLQPISLGSSGSSKKTKKRKTGLITAISSLSLKPAVILGNLATKGLEKITGKKYGRARSEDLAQTTFGRALGTATGATAAALSLAVAPLATAKVAALPTSFAILAPETTKKLLSVPGTEEIIVAGALGGPVAAIGVASEKGVSILGEILEDLPGKVGQYAPEIAAAGAAAAAIAGISKFGPDLLDRGRDVVSDLLPGSPLPAISEGAADSEISGSSPLMPITPEIAPEAEKPKSSSRKRRRQAPGSKISQSVRVNVIQRNSADRINKFIKNAAVA